MANGKQCGVSEFAGDIRFPFPEMKQEMRFLNIEVVDDTALIVFSKNPKRRRGNRKIKKIRLAYSRAEMLALNVDQRSRSKWSQVYAALPAPFAAEYDALLARPNPVFFANYGGGGAREMGKRIPLKISVH